MTLSGVQQTLDKHANTIPILGTNDLSTAIISIGAGAIGSFTVGPGNIYEITPNGGSWGSNMVMIIGPSNVNDPSDAVGSGKGFFRSLDRIIVKTLAGQTLIKIKNITGTVLYSIRWLR